MASDREALQVAIAHVAFALSNAELRAFTMTHVRTQELRLVVDALADPPSAPYDYAALANRLADFRFGSVLKPDGTERDPKEWLAFEPELMRALRDLAAPPSAQDYEELHRTTEGLLEAANIRIRQLIAALEEAQATKGNQ